MPSRASRAEETAVRTVALFVALVWAGQPASTAQSFALEEATISRIHAALASRAITCAQLARMYLDRIEAYDDKGPALRAIIVETFAPLTTPQVVERLISIGAFFPILMNTIAGVRHVDGIYLRAARNLGAGQMAMFRRVILPAATPYILTGARIGMGTAFIVVIVAEMIAVNNGLGYRILEAREYFWSDKIIAGMFTIGLLGLAIDSAMNALNTHLLKWHRGLDNN